MADLLQGVRRVLGIERVVREVHRIPDLQIQLAGHRVEIGREQVDGPFGRGERLRQLVPLTLRDAIVDRIAEDDDHMVLALLCIVPRRIDARCGGSLASGHHGGVREELHLVDLARAALAADERHRVPGDGRILGRIEAHGPVERVVVLDIELQDQAGEIRPRQVLLAQVVEVIEGIVEPEHSEVFCGLEDTGDGHTSGGCIVKRGRRATPREALQLEVAARIEEAEGFRSHLVLNLR